MKPIFGDDDLTRIQQAVKAAEEKTAGEIVAVVAGSSDSYAGWRALAAGTATVVLALLAYQFLPWLDAAWILVGQIPLVWMFWSVSAHPPVCAAFVPIPVQRRAAERQASLQFMEQGVSETRERSGVLILISCLERQVVILGDRGIHERVGIDGWRGKVDRITAGIQAGRGTDAICQVIDELGQELGAAFPRREDDVNELPDEVVHV